LKNDFYSFFLVAVVVDVVRGDVAAAEAKFKWNAIRKVWAGVGRLRNRKKEKSWISTNK
jgi:hypothetical protein